MVLEELNRILPHSLTVASRHGFLNLPTGDPIVTGINDVETNRGDAIIRYIDAMGHCSVQPFKGFNIVVIQQGGQRRVQKVIKQ